jgi:hypothetical protein
MMPSGAIQHALGLHLYQPPGNLRLLLAHDEPEAVRILGCYERIARHAHKYAHVARLHVALSVPLLEQLRDPDLIDACRHLADLPAILEGLRSAASIEFVGTGYRHAPLPLIPPDDWDEQLRNERVTIEAALGRVLKGYWPPAALFTAEMIPALLRAGYEYVLLPQSLLAMPDGSAADPYRAYRLSHHSWQIAAVPADGGFSHAQAIGLEAPWLADEVRNGVAQAPPNDAPYLLSTWSDGENGEWFRRQDEEQGFFGHFFAPYMEFCETGEFPVLPVHLSEYLRRHRPVTRAELRTTAPGAIAPSGRAETAETAETAIRQRLFRTSARYWELARAAARPGDARAALQSARELILEAEDSGLLLGDAAHRAVLAGLLDRADRLLALAPVPAPAPVEPPSPVLAAPAGEAVVAPPLPEVEAAPAPLTPAKEPPAGPRPPHTGHKPKHAAKRPGKRPPPKRGR